MGAAGPWSGAASGSGSGLSNGGLQAAGAGRALPQQAEAAREDRGRVGHRGRAAQSAGRPPADDGLLVTGAVGDRQQGGHGQGQQVPDHAHGVRATRPSPLPAAPPGPRKPCSIQWRQAYRAASVAAGGVSINRTQGSSCCGACSRTSVLGRGFRAKACPAPSQSVPGPPPSCRTGTRLPLVGRKVICGAWRRMGCQPNSVIRAHRSRLSSPRSHRTCTGVPDGTAGASCRSRRQKCATQDSRAWASTTCQATGIA